MVREVVTVLSGMKKCEVGMGVAIVLVLGWIIVGIHYFVEGTYVPLASRLSLDQSVQVTQVLKQENIRYRITQGGREILVRSSDLSQLSSHSDIQRVVGQRPGGLPKGMSSKRIQASNQRTVESIEQLAKKHGSPHAQASQEVQRALQKKFGAGVTQVYAYETARYDPWGLNRPISQTAAVWRTHVVLAVLMDTRWIEKQAQRGLMEIRRDKDLAASRVLDEEKTLTQLDVEQNIRQLLKELFPVDQDQKTYHVLVGFQAFDIPESQAQFSKLRGIFPFGGVGLILFLFSFLLFRAGVTFMRATLSSL